MWLHQQCNSTYQDSLEIHGSNALQIGHISMACCCSRIDKQHAWEAALVYVGLVQ